MGAIQQVMLSYGGAGAAATYNGLVATAAPTVWWRLDETSGTTAADNGSRGAPGTLTGGASFASAGVSIAAPSGYAGLGTGINLSASSVSDVRATGLGSTPTILSTNSGLDHWTIVLWMAGSAGGSQYALSNVNNLAVIYQFVTDTVEFYSGNFVGSDPRPGTGISLPASNTTTPHMIVYRYDSGTWSGFKDGASVFSVSRTFGVPSVNNIYLGSDSSSNVCNSRIWDMHMYARALSDTEIADLYAARNSP